MTPISSSRERPKVRYHNSQQLCDDLQAILERNFQWLVFFNSSKCSSFIYSLHHSSQKSHACCQLLTFSLSFSAAFLSASAILKRERKGMRKISLLVRRDCSWILQQCRSFWCKHNFSFSLPLLLTDRVVRKISSVCNQRLLSILPRTAFLVSSCLIVFGLVSRGRLSTFWWSLLRNVWKMESFLWEVCAITWEMKERKTVMDWKLGLLIVLTQFCYNFRHWLLFPKALVSANELSIFTKDEHNYVKDYSCCVCMVRQQLLVPRCSLCCA